MHAQVTTHPQMQHRKPAHYQFCDFSATFLTLLSSAFCAERFGLQSNALLLTWTIPAVTVIARSARKQPSPFVVVVAGPQRGPASPSSLVSEAWVSAAGASKRTSPARPGPPAATTERQTPPVASWPDALGGGPPLTERPTLAQLHPLLSTGLVLQRCAHYAHHHHRRPLRHPSAAHSRFSLSLSILHPAGTRILPIPSHAARVWGLSARPRSAVVVGSGARTILAFLAPLAFWPGNKAQPRGLACLPTSLTGLRPPRISRRSTSNTQSSLASFALDSTRPNYSSPPLFCSAKDNHRPKASNHRQLQRWTDAGGTWDNRQSSVTRWHLTQ
jgi:hypothetical protein